MYFLAWFGLTGSSFHYGGCYLACSKDNLKGLCCWYLQNSGLLCTVVNVMKSCQQSPWLESLPIQDLYTFMHVLYFRWLWWSEIWNYVQREKGWANTHNSVGSLVAFLSVSVRSPYVRSSLITHFNCAPNNTHVCTCPDCVLWQLDEY